MIITSLHLRPYYVTCRKVKPNQWKPQVKVRMRLSNRVFFFLRNSLYRTVVRFLEYNISASRLMDTFNPLTLSRYNTSCLTIMKERTPLNQLMAFKDSNVQRVIQLVHRVVQKSCRRACQLFCCPLDTMLCEKACPAQNQQITEDKTTQVAVRSLPSTILIVNISNSTLIDCVIGHESYPSAVAEGQPLMQGSGLHMYDQMTCSYSQGQQGAAQTSASPPPPLCPPLPPEQPPSINIHSSHLNFVIIGDNNYMHAEQICSNELEEPQV